MILAVKRAWDRIAQPRVVKVVYFFAYLVSVWTGWATLNAPPHNVSGEVGPVITAVWAGLFIIGGIVGTITVLPGWWWAERLFGIGFIGLGLAIYFVVVVGLHHQAAESGGSQLTQLGIIALASFVVILRFLFIREYSYEPRRR